MSSELSIESLQYYASAEDFASHYNLIPSLKSYVRSASNSLFIAVMGENPSSDSIMGWGFCKRATPEEHFAIFGVSQGRLVASQKRLIPDTTMRIEHFEQSHQRLLLSAHDTILGMPEDPLRDVLQESAAVCLETMWSMLTGVNDQVNALRIIAQLPSTIAINNPASEKRANWQVSNDLLEAFNALTGDPETHCRLLRRSEFQADVHGTKVTIPAKAVLPYRLTAGPTIFLSHPLEYPGMFLAIVNHSEYREPCESGSQPVRIVLADYSAGRIREWNRVASAKDALNEILHDASRHCNDNTKAFINAYLKSEDDLSNVADQLRRYAGVRSRVWRRMVTNKPDDERIEISSEEHNGPSTEHSDDESTDESSFPNILAGLRGPVNREPGEPRWNPGTELIGPSIFVRTRTMGEVMDCSAKLEMRESASALVEKLMIEDNSSPPVGEDDAITLVGEDDANA